LFIYYGGKKRSATGKTPNPVNNIYLTLDTEEEVHENLCTLSDNIYLEGNSPKEVLYITTVTVSVGKGDLPLNKYPKRVTNPCQLTIGEEERRYEGS